MLRGDAGMGKTALLDYASRVAADLRVVRLIGVESETDLALLSLLSDAATSGTIMVCIDDAQWLDSESIDTIAFVARRMHAPTHW